jgi:hypothetical protein
MKALTLDELKRMVDTQNAGMMDLCEILEYQEGMPSNLGKSVKSWIPRADPVMCGYNGQARREVMEGGQVTVTEDMAPGSEATVRSWQISQRLSEAGFDLTGVRLAGAASCRIRNVTPVKSEIQAREETEGLGLAEASRMESLPR